MAKRSLALLLILALVGGAGLTGFFLLDRGSDNSASDSAAADVPDVVAEVNGEEIGKSDFTEVYDAQLGVAQEQQAQGGQAPDEQQITEQVVQSLVTEELLTQEVERRNIEVSDAEVEETLNELATQNGLESVDAFVAALEEQGLDREQVDAEVLQRTQFDRLIAEEAGDVKATDKQVRELYRQLKAQQESAAEQGGEATQELPPLKDVRAELETQVESQQESEAATALIDGLRERAQIETFI